MPDLTGELYGHTAGARVFHVGAFAGPRIHGHPVAWTALREPGEFRLSVPPGRWYVHAVGGPTDGHGFLRGAVWGSHGGIYGLGAPAGAGAAPPEPLRIHVSPLWRDLTHVPHHRQPALSDDQWRAVDAVVAALGEDLACTVDGDLGRVAGFVRTRLSAVFKRATGLTMEEYRTRLRLEAAKALLAGSSAHVLEIALEVGYATSAQLVRMFQRYLGVTPSQFRQLAREVQAGGRAAPPPGDAPDPGSLRTLLGHAVPMLARRGATIQGEVIYHGSERGVIIYVAAFPGVLPDTYPAAWCALPGPGPFTLRAVPPGRHHILAVYCRRRMLYPGDFHTAFAYGGYGLVETTGVDPVEPVPLQINAGDWVGGITIELVEGDRAAGYARPWTDTFLPDGR